MLPAVRDESQGELLGQLLPPIQRRSDAVARQLDELAGQRTVMPPRERAAARDAAVGLRHELARLDLLASMTTRLLRPPAGPPRGSANVHSAIDDTPELRTVHSV